MIRPTFLVLLIAGAVANGACDRREPVAPAELFAALQEDPRLTDVALPLRLRTVAELRPRAVVGRQGVAERVGSVHVYYSGDALGSHESASAATEIHTVSAEWRPGADDSAQVLYTRFSRAITATLAREGACFSGPSYAPTVRVTRWSNRNGAVWLHWKLVDTFPSARGPIVNPPTVSVGMTVRGRGTQDNFEGRVPTPCS